MWGTCQMEIRRWMEMIQNIILSGGEAVTGLLLFSLQASVLKPTCQGEKMNRFPPAYGISTGAPIKQLASAALCTYRKQLILIAPSTVHLIWTPVSSAERILSPFLTRFFPVLLLWHMRTSSSVSLAASTARSLCSETKRSLPLSIRPPDVASPLCWSGLRC